MNNRLTFLLSLTFSICLFLSVSIQAQTINGTILGTVFDQQGAAIPGAQVTATNNETSFQRSVTTSEDGQFRICRYSYRKLLRPG
ncbi:MAG: carboxypeptidase regulatory-like domain-containing protein [Acidobacteria bacterium]|jgi:hypothetical protein|nr:carboxypeptidase regulatory-like domain-containing protein [Acidobacteriota bacterium]